MTITTLDLLGIGLYFALIAVFGFLTRRTKTFGEFSVGRHSVPAMMIFASLAATIVGPGFSVGFTSKGWSSGFLFYYLALAYAVQVALVGLFFAPRLSTHRDCHSLGDVMRKKYGRISHFLTGLVSVGTCIGFTAVMGKVGGGMLHGVTGWPLNVCLVVVTGSTALLTFTGGVRATIATEGLQFALFSTVVPLSLLWAAFSSPTSIAEIAEKAAVFTSAGAGKMTGLQMFGIALSFFLGETLIPPYANRALSAKSTGASRTGFLLAAGFCVIWLGIVAAFGIVAHGFLPENTSGDDVFIAMGKLILPSGVFGLLLAAVIAIVMSSQESVLNSSAVAFVRDIVGVFGALSDQTTLRIAKIATLGIAAVSVYLAQFAPSIIDGLLIIYSIWAPAMLIPLLLGLYLKRTSSVAGWASTIAGGSTSIYWQFGLREDHGVPAILAGLLAAGVVYAVCHFASRNLSTSGQHG